MSLQFTAAPVISKFRETFKSIDFRIAAIREGEQWSNALAVCRLTHEDVEQVQRRHNRARKIFGEIRTDVVRIEYLAEPFSKWSGLVAAIEKDNTVVVSGEKIMLGTVDAFSEKTSNISSGGGSIQDPEGLVEWNAYEISLGKFDWPRLHAYELTVFANVLGLSAFDQILNAVFETPVFGSSYPSHSLLFSIPIYAKPTSRLPINMSVYLSTITRL